MNPHRELDAMSLARISLALVLFSGIGCATVQPVPHPAQYIDKAHPSVLYVTYTDNSSVPVSQPRISGDSLFGTAPGVAGAEAVAVALHDVTEIRAPQPDHKRTVALIVAIGALTAAGAYTLTQVFGANCSSSSFHSDASAPATTTCAP
jgi:hypothetical protein